MDTNTIDRRIGQNIRAKRLTAGMSQQTLGDALGVSFQQVQKYEGGRNRVSAANLWLASVAIEVPVAAFFEGLGQGAQR